MHTSSLQIACGSLKLANITRLGTLCWDLQRSQRQLGTQFRLDFHWDFLQRIWGFGNLSFIIYQALQLGLIGAASCLLWCFLIDALSRLGYHQSPFVQDVMSLYGIYSMRVVQVSVHTAVYMCTYSLCVQCDCISLCRQLKHGRGAVSVLCMMVAWAWGLDQLQSVPGLESEPRSSISVQCLIRALPCAGSGLLF